jgi:hypothetical protein
MGTVTKKMGDWVVLRHADNGTSYFECGRCGSFNRNASKPAQAVRKHSEVCKGNSLGGSNESQDGEENTRALPVIDVPILRLVAFSSTALLQESAFWGDFKLTNFSSLEQKVLKMTSLSAGVFYVNTFSAGGEYLYVRYLETGAYRGYFSSLLPLLEAKHNRIVLPLQIFADEDCLPVLRTSASAYSQHAKALERDAKSLVANLSVASFRADVAHSKGFFHSQNPAEKALT